MQKEELDTVQLLLQILLALWVLAFLKSQRDK